MKYFIANWKANKNLAEAIQYINFFLNKLDLDNGLNQKLQNDKIKIVFAPPFPFLIPLKEKIGTRKNIHLASQDISHFEDGAYTGEVTGRMLNGLVDFAIVAHSERRTTFNENYQTLAKKVDNAKKFYIEPIYCIRDEKDTIPIGVNIVAYEPVYAIGSGNNEDPNKVKEKKLCLKLKREMIFVYGGSVKRDNAADYLTDNIADGFLIGSSSLDPIHFYDIVKLA